MPKFFNSAPKAGQRQIPTIGTPSELEGYLKIGVRGGGNKPVVPAIPWNFSVVSKQGGNVLSWSAVTGADGYIVDKSTSADFSASTVVSVPLPGAQQTQYFDQVGTAAGATPTKMFYRVKATSGTQGQPQSVLGLPSGVVASTAIAPNDTVTASVTVADTTTSDNYQKGTGKGNYRDIVSNPL